MKAVSGIPVLGFGTYGRRDAEGQAAIEKALEVGYRHIDTAQTYKTEPECGAALAASGMPRDEVFVTTKIDTANYSPGLLLPSLEASLKNLQLDVVDLTLLHWPSPNGKIALPIYLEQLVAAFEAGLTRHIGVSNFTIALLEQAKAVLGDIPILTNQVELHPYLQNRKLAEYCQANGIAVTCYRPIAEGRINGDAVIEAIAATHNATAAQVALAFEFSQGYIAIPTSGKDHRISENFGGLSLTLSDIEIEAMRGRDRNERYVAPDWGPDWD